MITLYSRCGKVAEAKMLFDRMTERNTVSYNSIIAGLAQHGHAAEALKLFEGMLNSEYELTEITFISVLSACSHTGKIDEGWDYFNSMKPKYEIDPCEEHYSCMIDLLARARKFDEAEELMSHPVLKRKPNASHMCVRIKFHIYDRQYKCISEIISQRKKIS
jgi:pentatricopeptide repeat protein